MTFIPYVWLVPVFPLLGFLINGLFGKKISKRTVSLVGPGVVGLSFFWVCGTFWEYLQLPASAKRRGVWERRFREIKSRVRSQ